MLDYNSHKNRFFHCNFFSRSFHYIYTFQTSLSVLIILILSRRIFSKMLPDESELAFCARNPFDQSWKISSYQAPRHCSGGVVFGSVFAWKTTLYTSFDLEKRYVMEESMKKTSIRKKKTDFLVSRFAISLKKKQQQQQERQQQNENKETDRTEEEQKKQPWRNCASHELPNREKISLALYKCATRILFLNKWKPETSILSGQDKHWTLCYLLLTGFFLNLVLFFLLSIFVSFWHFLTWPRPGMG